MELSHGICPNSDHHENMNNTPNSHFKQTVCLADWWLVKSENDFEGRRLAVAGFTCREKQAMRVFSSAPILKRYDAFTVETTDGICVIFKGFINKAQTVENGFPSDVYGHFVFGFPPYWKEYVENFMGKESTSKDILGFNLLKRLSPRSEMESAQPHIDNCEKDLWSQGKIDVKGMRKSKKTKSSAVPLPKKSDSVISSSEYNLIMSCIVPGGFATESYCGGPTVEDHTTLDMPVNCRKNKMMSLPDSSLGGNLNISAVIDEVVDDSQIHASKGILSACHLLNRSTDSLRKVELDRRKSMKANFNKDMSSSEASLTHTEGRVRTRSMSSLKMKQKYEKKSDIITGGENIRSNCVSSLRSENVEFAPVDCEPEGRNNWNSEVTELHGSTDKTKLSEFEAGSVKDECVQISRTPNQDNDLGNAKTKGNIEKAKIKATRSLSTVAAADNQKDNVIPDINSLSDKGKASDMRTRRKLAYETPDREKDKVCASPPQGMSFNRSRSGRLLMPILEFWRNQRAIYDADRTITGIEEGIIHPEQQRKGSPSTAQRKKRKRT